MEARDGSGTSDSLTLGVVEEGRHDDRDMPYLKTRLLRPFFEHLDELLVTDHLMVDVTSTLVLEIVVIKTSILEDVFIVARSDLVSGTSLFSH